MAGAGPFETIEITPSCAAVADDYTKKPAVFRLYGSTGSEYLLQASDAADMMAWIKAINGCARKHIMSFVYPALTWLHGSKRSSSTDPRPNQRQLTNSLHSSLDNESTLRRAFLLLG